jgi:hypothetical protein
LYFMENWRPLKYILHSKDTALKTNIHHLAAESSFLSLPYGWFSVGRETRLEQ